MLPARRGSHKRKAQGPALTPSFMAFYEALNPDPSRIMLLLVLLVHTLLKYVSLFWTFIHTVSSSFVNNGISVIECGKMFLVILSSFIIRMNRIKTIGTA